jgi:ribosomal-protein-alanine N-acetyltransferase
MNSANPFEPMLIPTEKQSITLRRWKSEDKTELVKQANNLAVWQNLTDRFPNPYTEADADFWITFSNQPSSSIYLCIDVSGLAAGSIGIIAGEGAEQKTGLFGYWLGEKYWGKGIATIAAKALVAYARENFHFERLEAPVFKWNRGSMRVLEKAGFVRDESRHRSICKDGEMVDTIMYTLTLGND